MLLTAVDQVRKVTQTCCNTMSTKESLDDPMMSSMSLSSAATTYGKMNEGINPQLTAEH